MFDKLVQAQQMAEEIKKRLDLISVTAEVEGGKIRITSTANKHITAISIDPGFMQSVDLEELEELLAAAVNKALAQADNVNQTEMQAVTRDMMGGLGNLFGK
ncbi:MAG: YbaB/EbfC family nucleoid-associated protein [Daejeonella sp.]|uniref:YbaB/EbfC family nucleoid-associated protein n=1 Tax=Daejeonella sp. TaxID=2805397 RepID=UPI0027365EBD|nr:YbaB/EbfC family nucleoid-associated protein [Daejeonella sp.]MDP3467177.1 YbaB/EbfC family nucleoid-associated protein [Daejeonella sp.]